MKISIEYTQKDTRKGSKCVTTKNQLNRTENNNEANEGQKTNGKMSEVSHSLSVITLNIDGLYSPTKKAQIERMD